MKRIFLLILCLLTALMLFACGGKPTETTVVTDLPTESTTLPETTEATVETTGETVETTGVPEEFTYPEGLTVWDVELAGLTAEEGYDALCQRLRSYTLPITVNGVTVRVSGSAVGLTYSENAFIATTEALAAGENALFDKPLRYSVSALRGLLTEALDVPFTNAYIVYDSAAGHFRAEPDMPGYETDLTEVLEKADDRLLSLGSGFSLSAEVQELVADIPMDSTLVTEALSAAESCIALTLTYSYTADEGFMGEETLSKDTLASFIGFDKDLNLTFNTTAIKKYAERMDESYQHGGRWGRFPTTGGGTVNLSVKYLGQAVDTDALAKDILQCLETKTSGKRNAPYLEVSPHADLPYNGTYIEVNLSEQHLWYYIDGELFLESPIVSGCVSKGWWTPAGVFSIYQKFTNSWISGGTAYVNCFMAYDGNYGLHDATWRSSFGGDIYLTNGSHGCSNMPKAQALKLYRNAPIGTKVILYGGATSVDMITQEITGTDSYRLTEGSPAFQLDTAPLHGMLPLTYVSSDSSVAEVTSDGTVILKGLGTATITVSCEQEGYYTAAEKKITVQVCCPCEDGNYIHGQWELTTPPSCAEGEETFSCRCGKVHTRPVQPTAEHSCDNWTETTPPACGKPGEETGTCSGCQSVLTRPVAALDHDFASGGSHCDRGCGAENPDFIPPDTTSPEEETT